MDNLRIIFMGTPEFAVPSLRAIHGQGYQILKVITQPDRPRGRGQKLSYSAVKEAALDLGLEVWQPARVKDPDVINIIRTLQPDLILVVAFGQILPEGILEIPALGCINLHGSLLPAYRGAAPIQRAIINGEKETGVTTMLMDTGLDSGDMLLKETVEIPENMTFGQLHDLLAEVGAKLLAETVRLRQENKLLPQPQDSSQATYAPMIKREDELIHWDNEVKAVHNQVRGLRPWPGAYTFFNGQPLKIRGSLVFQEDSRSDQPGRVIQILKGEGFVVQCGKGSLLVTAVQPVGKREIFSDDFVNGYRLEVGHVFRTG